MCLAAGNDDELFAVLHVGHRRAPGERVSRSLQLPAHLVCQKRATHYVAHPPEIPVTGSWLKPGRQTMGSERSWVRQPHVDNFLPGAVAVNAHPQMIAAIHIDGSDSGIGWLYQRQPFGAADAVDAAAAHIVKISLVGVTLFKFYRNGVGLRGIYKIRCRGSKAAPVQLAPPAILADSMSPLGWVVYTEALFETCS